MFRPKRFARAAVYCLVTAGYAILWMAFILGILFFAYEPTAFIYMNF
ncbi:hypothetical protein [Paenibacillus sp. GCM10027626]